MVWKKVGGMQMVENNPKRPKSTSWKGIPKKRCKTEGCKKRVRSYQELGLCNRCVNLSNESSKKRKLRESKQ